MYEAERKHQSGDSSCLEKGNSVIHQQGLDVTVLRYQQDSSIWL
jgi:hypothetical protein